MVILGSCWGGSFRLEDECGGFSSLFGALVGCNVGKVGFHQDGVLYGDVFVLCFNEAFEDSSVLFLEDSGVGIGNESWVESNGRLGGWGAVLHHC